MFAFPSYLQVSCREPCGGSINVRVVRMLPFLPLCIDIMLDSTGSLATRFRCNAMGWTFGYHMQERRVTGMKGNGHASSGLVPAESSHISGIFDIACIDEGTPNETTARTIETYIQASHRESGPLRTLTYRCLSGEGHDEPWTAGRISRRRYGHLAACDPNTTSISAPAC